VVCSFINCCWFFVFALDATLVICGKDLTLKTCTICLKIVRNYKKENSRKKDKKKGMKCHRINVHDEKLGVT